MRGGVGGDQQAVQLQFEHCMDSKLSWNCQSLLDCNLASPEHLHVVHRVSVHLQSTLKKRSGIALTVELGWNSNHCGLTDGNAVHCQTKSGAANFPDTQFLLSHLTQNKFYSFFSNSKWF